MPVIPAYNPYFTGLMGLGPRRPPRQQPQPQRPSLGQQLSGPVMGGAGAAGGKAAVGGLMSLGSGGGALAGAQQASTSLPMTAFTLPGDAAAASAAPAASTGGLGGALSSAAPLALGGLVGLGQVGGAMNALQGEKMSVPQQAALALPTFGASFLWNPLVEAFGSGKGKAQKARDSFRDALRSVGIYSGDSVIDLGNGESYDTRTHATDQSYNVNFEDPQMGNLVGLTDPLTEVLFSGQDATTRSQMAGELANAAASSSNPEQTIRFWFQKAGIDRDAAYGKILEMDIPIDKKEAYLASIDRLFGVPNPFQGQGGAAEFPLRAGQPAQTAQPVAPAQESVAPGQPQFNEDEVRRIAMNYLRQNPMNPYGR